MQKSSRLLFFAAMMLSCSLKINTAAESQKLLETDWAFAKMSEAKDAAIAFNEFLADDAMMFPMGAHPISGRNEIHAAMLASPGSTLTWEPQKAEIAKAGDMGWTWGKYRSERTGEDGQPIVRYGKYVNVWKKQANDEWRVIADIGNPSPAPEQ